jgi:hypothetical protein
MPDKPYAVFLSFNSEDRAAVEKIAIYLQDKVNLRSWFDQWELIPGESWVENLQRGLATSETCAVFVGKSGEGPWQKREVEVALQYQVYNHKFRVIPVLLPDAPKQPELPMFLAGNMWVDFRGKRLDDDDTLWRLECGIRGETPGRGRLFSQSMRPTAEQQEDLDRKIELLRQENLQKDKIRQTSQRKSVGTKPYVEKLFVDRVAYLEKLTEYACGDETHLIMIVGQGGIGKTALAAKFCDEIEKAGYVLTPHPTPLPKGEREQSPSPNPSYQGRGMKIPSPLRGECRGEGSFLIRAIVYVSKTEMAAFTLEQVFAKLAQTLAPDDAARLEPILKDPKTDAALKTEKLLDYLRGEPTLLVLDNFEAVLAETQPAVRGEPVEPRPSTSSGRTEDSSRTENVVKISTGSNIVQSDLDAFLHTVCATQHSLKVIITSRYEVNLKTFGVCQKIVLNEGLKIEDAVDFLRRLGHDVTQIQQASDAELRQLAQKVHGVPMALRSLAGFLVEREQRRLTVAQLLADLTRFVAFKKHGFKEGLRKLIDEQYWILPEAAQLALQAMAVYNAPVKPVAVQYLFPARRRSRAG